ncbi:MAG: TonB family protein, partial [Candidatus Eremiobacteraeota bacterium]|nr:TonB family protein [Candidatus Eremiobacteraeota bacterium]
VTAVEPEVPELARERGATGDVDVRVDLTATGGVTAVAIARSADPALDNAALDAARRSTYAPAIDACHAEPGSYLFRVRFDG